MNDVVFSTGGDWDSTTLYNNGQEVLANRMFVQLQCGRDADGEPMRGGVTTGGEISAFVNTQDNPSFEQPIFPGRLVVRVPRHEVVVENTHPSFLFETTQVWFDQQDVTESILDLYLDVDAVNNVVQGQITIYKPHLLAADEVATFNLF